MHICSDSNFSSDPLENPLKTENHLLLKSPKLLRDRYRLLHLLGEGGFGRTFLAVDELQSPLQCVVKQLLSNHSIYHQKVLTLFYQEAEYLAKLWEHPQIPRLLDIFEQDGEIFIVQEWIDGWTLAQEVKDSVPFHEIEVRKVLQDLLPILQYLHDRQIVHRDIKPDNIIRRKCDHQLVLVDFGSAKQIINIRPIHTGTMIGSVEYAAPEQIKGRSVFASDLYSLGVTCLYLLTQTSPFDLYDIVENDWKWEAYLTQSISPELRAILNKLLQPLVRQRYQSATEVLIDLNVSSGSNWQLEKVSISTSVTKTYSPQPATVVDNYPVQKVPLFADDLTELKELPFVQRVIIVGIGIAVSSLAIASLSFCLGIILFTLNTPRTFGVNPTKDNQITLSLVGLVSLVSLVVLENKQREALKKNGDSQHRDKKDEDIYFG